MKARNKKFSIIIIIIIKSNKKLSRILIEDCERRIVKLVKALIFFLFFFIVCPIETPSRFSHALHDRELLQGGSCQVFITPIECTFLQKIFSSSSVPFSYFPFPSPSSPSSFPACRAKRKKKKLNVWQTICELLCRRVFETPGSWLTAKTFHS